MLMLMLMPKSYFMVSVRGVLAYAKVTKGDPYVLNLAKGGVYWAQTFHMEWLTGEDASDAIASEICNALQNLSSFPLWSMASKASTSTYK